MSLIDFIIGGLLANAMPHLIFGLTNTHFLGMFGYTPKGNILYASLQLLVCLVLFFYTYGIEGFLENSFFIGGLSVLIAYFVVGKFLVEFYGKEENG